jgi:hypothetical protein
MVGPIPYIWGPHLGPPMVETHGTWNVGGVLFWGCFLRMGCLFDLPKWAPLPSSYLFFYLIIIHFHVISQIISLIFLIGYPRSSKIEGW